MQILIVDDHAMLRQGLKKILSEITKPELISEASSGVELMNYLSKEKPDVILLDVSLPGRSGLDLLADIQTVYSSAKIIILSMHPEHQYAVRAIKLGAKGYLHKSAVSEELIKAVQRVAAGHKYITSAVADGLADKIHADAAHPHQALSGRELEVLRHMAMGQMPKDIARELSLSPKTISTLRDRILAKLGLQTNADIIRFAIKEGLVE